MIDLHYWPTPNGHKITMFLEEAGLAYKIRPVNIVEGDQFKPDFLKLSPNNRMPAIVDHMPADGGAAVCVFESGAIPVYLADKTGRGLGDTRLSRIRVPGPAPSGPTRKVKGRTRLYGVLNKRLADHEFLAGDYSIADMASYPWIVPHKRQGQDLADFPHLERWFAAIKARPGTMRAYEAGRSIQMRKPEDLTAAEKGLLFGQDSSVVKP